MKKKQPEIAPAPHLWKREPALVLIPLLFLLCLIAFLRTGTIDPAEMRIAGIDSVAYYAYAHSILFDRDLNFENEYRALNPDATLVANTLVDPYGPRTPTGLIPNVFAIGPGLAWTPFVAAAYLASDEKEGYGRPYAIAIYAANMFYGLAASLLIYGFLRPWFAPRIATISAVSISLCSSALYYTFAKEILAHATSLCAVALFLFMWSRARQMPIENKRQYLLIWCATGFCLGIAMLMRWQNALFVLIPLVDCAQRQRKHALTPLLCLGICAALAFTPQMAAWRILYGSYLTLPQGQGFMNWTAPNILAALFSRSHGLFLWTPICLLGPIGLFRWRPEWRPFLPACATVFILQVYISAAAGDPGWSFSMRRLTNTIPLLAFGLAALFHLALRPRNLSPESDNNSARKSPFEGGFRGMFRTAWIITAVLALWNFLSILQFTGYIDHLYVADALQAEYNISPQSIASTEQLEAQLSTPDTPFDYDTFKRQHIFPRDHAPTWSQFITDKFTILFLLIS